MEATEKYWEDEKETKRLKLGAKSREVSAG